MLLEIDVRQKSLTAVQVNIEIDAETCFLLSQVFKELGAGLYAAQARYNASRRWQADEPMRNALAAQRRAAVARRMDELKALPFNKLVSLIGKELELGYDLADILCREIRQDARHEALRQRDEKIIELRKSGMSLKAIAKNLDINLSRGTLSNILHRARRAKAGTSKAKDSG